MISAPPQFVRLGVGKMIADDVDIIDCSTRQVACPQVVYVVVDYVEAVHITNANACMEVLNFAVFNAMTSLSFW